MISLTFPENLQNFMFITNFAGKVVIGAFMPFHSTKIKTAKYGASLKLFNPFLPNVPF